eukprot:TRINITY_DN1683_c0_g2_i1.p1 TRINITY_DN1683_c0_g2~~TRINITY_DN1683_c0_g2_i1.p1  ORF type:complete len:323 (-),score=90.64 TRINITY_DN1683_c0_g2_i1:195-1163(-)
MTMEYYVRLFKLICLRLLARFGFWLFNRNEPSPSFSNRVKCHSSNREIELLFYVPKDYEAQISKGKKYPVVLNFHGGGFCLGRATDDTRWGRIVMEETDAVFVSVEYGLAPELPYPVAVDDGVDALLYLDRKKESLGLNGKFTLTGFSAGGNLSLTIPLRLTHRLKSEKQVSGVWKDSKIVSIVAWYPSVDKTISREEKKKHAVRPDKCMSPVLTNLFDPSYAQPHERSSPFCSPAKASDKEIQESFPDDIQLILCEWDMLMHEGREYAKRLQKLRKNVDYQVIKEVVHAWDKTVREPRMIREVESLYREVCGKLRLVLHED